jgi:hypothetical protein
MRTVIYVQQTTGQDHSFILTEAPVQILQRIATPLGIGSADPRFASLWQPQLKPDAVAEAGKALFTTLSQREHVHEVFEVVLNSAAGNSFPICVDLDSPEAENIPWEALHSTKDFLALDRRWPIVRLAAAAMPPPILTRIADDRWKISLILSAAGIAPEDEIQEWRNIVDGLRGLSPSACFQVLVSHDRVKAEIESSGLDGISVDYLGPDVRSLQGMLTAFGPNFVHFFCHGSANPLPQLDIARRSDRLRPEETSSLAIEAKDLEWMADLETVWLVTLNCCSGGKPAGNIRALGSELVQKGIPAAIAMRSEVTVADAHQFSREFYRALVTVLLPRLPVPGILPQDFDGTVWGEALRQVREKLIDARSAQHTRRETAANCVEWILPVLYLHRSPLQLYRRSSILGLTAEQRSEYRSTLANLRKKLPIELGQSHRRQVQEAENQLYQPPGSH